MRHPNVVWVYGIVLKPMNKDDEDDDDELGSHDGGKALTSSTLNVFMFDIICFFAQRCIAELVVIQTWQVGKQLAKVIQATALLEPVLTA